MVDPGSGKAFASCPVNDASDVDATVQHSADAFKKYRQILPRARAKILYDWHNLIVANRDDIAKVITYETGKPLAEANGESTLPSHAIRY